MPQKISYQKLLKHNRALIDELSKRSDALIDANNRIAGLVSERDWLRRIVTGYTVSRSMSVQGVAQAMKDFVR